MAGISVPSPAVVRPQRYALPMAEDLELPRPLRLLLTAGWNLTESVGLPVAAYVAAAWLDGRNAGLIAGLVAIWLTATIRKIATGSVPSLLTISAVVLTVQTAVVLATGELWLFLLQFPLANFCMCVLFARTGRGPNPLWARLAAEVVALRQPATYHPGLYRFFQGATWLWAGIFLLLTAGLAVLMVTEPTKMFLMGSEERRVGKECRSPCDWSTDVCSSDLPCLPGGDLAVGGNLPAPHGRPGGADGDRADQNVPHALNRRHGRARRRRDRRVHPVVPLGPAQARAQAPFCPR